MIIKSNFNYKKYGFHFIIVKIVYKILLQLIFQKFSVKLLPI